MLVRRRSVGAVCCQRATPPRYRVMSSHQRCTALGSVPANCRLPLGLCGGSGGGGGDDDDVARVYNGELIVSLLRQKMVEIRKISVGTASDALKFHCSASVINDRYLCVLSFHARSYTLNIV